MDQQQVTGNILALDIGQKRIGLATAHTIARLPHPLITLENDEAFVANLLQIIQQESVVDIVAGLPRNLSGDETEQTQYVRDFIAELEDAIGMEIQFQDEALTSQKAEAELKRRGGIKNKGDVDALAATYILEDYLNGES